MRRPNRWSRSPGLAALALALALLSLAPAASAFDGRVHALAGTRVLVLQPDGVNGSDAFAESLAPLWNFGNNGSLLVGPNATTGGLARSFVGFRTDGIPSNATIVNATLRLYETEGSGGSVEVHPALANWTEGSGGHSWTVVPVTVRETAGVNRTREPVGVTVPFTANSIMDPARDLRVYDGGTEVPSQVYAYTYSGGVITSAKVFFDATVGAFASRTFDIVYSTNGTSVPAYRTATWGTSPTWVYGPTGGGASGATVADIDRDGRLEVVFGGTDGYVYCLDDHGQLKWRTLVSPGQSVPFTPQVAAMDRTGNLDVVVSTNAPSVVRLNSTGSIVWTYASPSILFTTPTLVDVNGDGVPDALVGSNSRNVWAIDGANGTLYAQYTVNIAGYTATIADVDGSGTPEILVPGDDRAVHAFQLNGTQLWTSAAAGASFLEGSVAFGDVNGDGFPEVVTGDAANNGLEFALYASNGTEAWAAALPSYRYGGQTLATLAPGGPLTTLVGVQSGQMFALRGTDGATLWTYAGGTLQPGTPAVVDLDRSGRPEIVFLQGGTAEVLDPQGLLAHAWSFTPPNLNLRSSSQYPMTGPAIADIAGNGTLTVLVPTAGGMAAYATGGLDYDWRTWGYNANHTQRARDGASGSGAALLQATLGVTVVHAADGVSWNYRDGTTAWAMPGGVVGPAAASAPASPGWMAWNLTGAVQDWVSGATPDDGFVLMEASEITGTVHMFVAYDSAQAAERPSLTIAYVLGPAAVPGRYPPQILGPIPDLSRPENAAPFSVDMLPYAYDNSTSLTQLRWNVTGFDPTVFVTTGLNTVGNHVLTFYPQPQAFGAYRVTYWLTDPKGRFATAQAWVNITYADQPPAFAPPATLYVHYNLTYTFDFGPYILDPDTPRSGLVLRSNDSAHAAVSGFNVSFRYDATFLDTWAFVTLTVSDGTFNVSRIIAVKVTADDPPVLRKVIPDQTLWEGQVLADAFNLGDYFTDPNNDSLYYTTGYTHLYVTIHPNRSVDIGAIANWWGQEYVTFRATDPTGAIAEDTILVTVLHVSKPPSIGPVPDLRVHYDSPFYFDLGPYLADPDTPVALLNVSASDPHVTASGHLLTFLYPYAYNGTVANVTLSASDGTFTTYRTIRVNVGSDWPPMLRTKMPNLAFPEGTSVRGAYDLPGFFTDFDNALLYWSSGNRNVLVTIHANGSVDLASVPEWSGVEQVTFRATDPQGALAEDSVWITVTPVDSPPSFRAIPRQFMNTTTAYLPLAPYLRDPDTNVTELVLTGTNSTHAQVIGQGLLFRFTEAGTAYVRVTVSDGNLTNETTIVVVVALPSSGPAVVEEIPGFVYWAPVAAAVAGLAVFVAYRYRKLEWAFLVTNSGLLVSSISRHGEGSLDTDLLTGMLTTIMDFATKSFSDERNRNLEGLELGEKRVAIVKGKVSYLAVVYRGRTPGGLLRIMRSVLSEVETEHRDALGDVVDSTKLGDIPVLLQRLVTRGSLPSFAFRAERTRET